MANPSKRNLHTQNAQTVSCLWYIQRLAVLIVLLLSSVWTVFLAFLNVTPNDVANYLMNTTQFDDGDFWQLSESDASVMVASAVGLGLVSAIYLYLTVLVMRPRANHTSKRQLKQASTLNNTKTAEQSSTVYGVINSAWGVYSELVNQRGRYRKEWNLAMEIPEMTFQTLTLHSLLSTGLAPSLVYAYVGLMVLNCVYCFYHIVIAWKQHAFYEVVGDAVLDLVFAVAFPAITLTIAVHEFRGGLRVMQSRQAFFPAESYERRSRLFGDANQINAFTTAFQRLQIQTSTELVVTVGFNLLTCLRWRRIVATLAKRRPQSHSKQIQDAKMTQIAPTSHTNTALPSPKRPSHLIPVSHRVIPAYVGIAFLVYGTLVALSSFMAIRSSTAACDQVDFCTRHAYVWYPGAPTMACPCLTYIEGQVFLARRMVDGNAIDATRTLSIAAESGYLRTIQLVNRRLPASLPPFVERCHNLQHLVLVGCELSGLPTGWAETFTKLEYLHITGGSGYGDLKSLPATLFESTPSLRTLYLHKHNELEHLPPFTGLSKLQLLFIGETSVRRLPTLDHITRLKMLALVSNPVMTYLPELAPIAQSIQAIHVGMTAFCCSGFLTGGACNFSEPPCSLYDPDSTWNGCYPGEKDIVEDPRLVIGSTQFPLVSTTSRAVLQPFVDDGRVCASMVPVFMPRVPPFSSWTCEGIWFRKCRNGICYSYELGSPLCVNDSRIVEMRKLEIQQSVECDPVEEEWLGCGVHTE